MNEKNTNLSIDQVSPVLVVGAGYVGQALVARLRSHGLEVFALRRRPLPAKSGEFPLSLDLNDPTGLERIPRMIRSIVYLVSPDTPDDAGYQAAYLHGLENLLRSSPIRQGNIQRILFASSTAVYAQADGSWVDETSVTAPTSFSGRRLLEAEQLLQGSRFRQVCVRFAGIYGPGRQRLLTSVLEGRASVPTRKALTNRIHREDCAGLLEHLLRLPEPEPLYIGVDDEPAELREVLEWLAQATGKPPPRVCNTSSERRRGACKRCSNVRLRSSGYELSYPTFREGYGAMISSRPDGTLR